MGKKLRVESIEHTIFFPINPPKIQMIALEVRFLR